MATLEVDAMAVKLKDGEAVHLAALILRVARPRTQDEAEEVMVWVKRLNGGGPK